MGIAGVGYGSTVPYYPHINNRTGKKAESQNMQPEGQSSGNITLNWSDGAVFASGTPDGQSFSIYKADDYSAENPILNIKGMDKNGNSYEQQINPLTVDSENASYVEMMAVNIYLVDVGELDANDFSAFERPTEDDLEKADYLKAIREGRDTQYSVGNMVGYHKAANVCNALVNLKHEQDGTVKMLKGADGPIRVMQMEERLQSGIIGMSSFGAGDNFRFLEARYADDSTTENPVIEVRISEEFGAETVFKVNINDINPTNATQLEMFALCSHAEAQGISSSDRNGDSYMSLIEYAGAGGYEADNIDDFVGKKQDWTQIVEEAPQTTRGSSLLDRLNGKQTAPYSYLAKDGVIEYNGVTFNCDYDRNRITLGDVSNSKDCLNIPLSGGGSLAINRDNLGDLAHAIGMFSPEDIRRIMEAIAQDNKAQEMQKEIDDDTNSLGDSADKAIGNSDAENQETEKQETEKQTTEAQLSKAQLDKILKDANERAFEAYGPNAPDEVKQAWIEAAEETGANGAGLDAGGMATHITVMSAERAVKWFDGDSDYADTLGNSVESAIAAAQQALNDLEDPLQPLSMRGTEVQEQIEKEKAFYNSFLEKLQSL